MTPPSLDNVLGRVVNVVNAFLFTLGPALLIAMIAYAAIQRMLAADNPQGIKQSNQIIFYAVVGYVVVTVGFVIIGLAMGVVNFSNGIPTLFDLHF